MHVYYFVGKTEGECIGIYLPSKKVLRHTLTANTGVECDFSCLEKSLEELEIDVKEIFEEFSWDV